MTAQPASTTSHPGGRNLALRVVSAAVGLPIVLAAAWAGPAWTATLVALAALAGLREFHALSSGPRLRSLEGLGYLWALGIVVAAYVSPDTLPHALAAGLLASLALVVALRRRDAGLTWAWTLSGVAYTTLLLSYAVLLRALPDDGRGWLFFALAVTFAADTGAYFTGRLLGRHRMAPSISPGKTWEGFVGGLAWAAGAATLVGWAFALPPAWWALALFGLVVGAVAAIGDLAESLLKRSAGAKEAGHLIPGHGGILDRLDSVVFALPAVYYGVVVVLA